jgi:site-specific recombinase XerD
MDLEEYIFLNERTGTHITQFGTTLTQLCKRASIQHLRFHDLRHIFASAILEKGGGDLLTLADLLGHSSLTHVQRYAHLSRNHRDNIVNTMVSKLIKD